MKILPRIAFVVALAPIFVGVAVAKSSPSSSSRGDSSPVARAPLEVGMAGEDIKAAIGPPRAVRQVKTETGRVEIWTYERVLETAMVQTPTQVQMVPAFRGIGADGPSQIGLRPMEIYSHEQITRFQLTELLMLDGRLLKGKQWREDRRTFQ